MRTKEFLVMTALVGLSLPLSAATIPVTTTDPAPAADGQCSLIEAIDNANADAATHADCPAGSGADTIELASSAVYELDEVSVNYFGPNGLPIIGSNVTIEGRNSNIRRAPVAPEFRIFVVNSSGNLTLNDVTLENGAAGVYAGGALYNYGGMLMLTGSTVTGNSASGAGGIYNRSGTVTLTDSEISFNTGTAGIGGLSSVASTSDAVVVIERSLIHGNQAIGSGAGGIFTGGSATHQAELHISGSVITDNTSEATSGGIRSSSSRIEIDDSTIAGNTADYACGGLFVEGSIGDIDGTTISNNTVLNTVDLGTGGGLCVSDSTTTITNSTISGNVVLGPSTGQSYSGRGGGISLVGGPFGVAPTADTVVIVEDSTICDNTAETVGGGISVYRDTGTMAVELELRNTIVADNYEGVGAVLGNCVMELPALITSEGFNLTDDPTCNMGMENDRLVEAVMLTPLQYNGGPTWTHQPLSGSPAVDSGDDLLCSADDQNGNIRPWDGDGSGQVHCDRGAVELGAPYFHGGFETGDTTGWSNTVP